MSWLMPVGARYDPILDLWVLPDGSQVSTLQIQQMTYPGLNPYQGLGGLHGGHWNASQATHSNPALGAYPGDTGASAQLAQQAALQQAHAQLLAQQAAINNAYAQQRAGLGNALTGMRCYGEPKIKHAGIKAGEIIAWRCWTINIRDMTLRSVFVGVTWKPGEPMTGDISFAGVHAWKDKDVAHDYIQHLPPYVVGQVKLWGEVIEHEKGYRAENAKIVSLDEIEMSHWGFRRHRIILNLRKKYGVN